jgi:hypothetical protein
MQERKVTVPPLLAHDTSHYAELFERVLEISSNWPSPQARAQQLAPLTEIWRELEHDDGSRALPKSMVAHLLADLQSDPVQEVHWDLESLRALSPVWEQRADPRLFDAGCRSLPSIYLSLACGARKCGDQAGAREYIRRARLILPVLPASHYTSRLTRAIESVERTLAAAGPA